MLLGRDSRRLFTGVSSLRDLLNKIAFVKFDAVSFEEPFKLGTNGFFFVMFFLRFDVTDGLFQERGADTESTVTFLPGKVFIVFV